MQDSQLGKWAKNMTRHFPDSPGLEMQVGHEAMLGIAGEVIRTFHNTGTRFTSQEK